MSNKPDISAEPPVGLTFREKSLWVTLVSTLAIYAYYFVRVLQIGEGDPAHVGAVFVATVIIMVVTQAVVHAALAIHKRPERTDERDVRIALVSTRNAYYVLAAGVWCALSICAMPVSAFWVAHAGLLALVVAEVVRCATQLVLYRRGIA